MGDTGSPRYGGKSHRTPGRPGGGAGGDAERGVADDAWADDEYDPYTHDLAAPDELAEDDHDDYDDDFVDVYDDPYDNPYDDPEPVPVSRFRREPPRDRRDASTARGFVVPAFLAGLLVGLLVLGLAWTGTALMGDDGDPAATVAARSNHGEQTGEQTGEQPGQQGDDQGDQAGDATGSGSERLQRCARSETHLEAPLRAAEPAMAQWEVHVGAMNKLVTGAISLQQANAFWNQTRVGAQRKLARLDDAVRTLQREGVDCPRPEYVPPAWALHSCAQRVAAEESALRAATAAADTWRMHVRDMEMLREGQLSPAEATRMWLASWQWGMRQLKAYRAAESALPGSGSCPDPS